MSFMLNVIYAESHNKQPMLSAIMLNVFTLNVVAPLYHFVVMECWMYANG